MWDSNSWTTIKELLSFFLMLFLCLMSVQTDLLVPWCDFMKAAGDQTQPPRVVNTNRKRHKEPNICLFFYFCAKDFSFSENGSS